MKHVNVAWNEDVRGFWTDPREYLRCLPDFQELLPAGAREYVLLPGHYDFGSVECVKDLKFAGMEFSPDEVGSVRVSFSANPWKHDSGMWIDYTGVSGVTVERPFVWSDAEAYGTVLLDEVLPGPEGGCTHEIALTSATLKFACGDLKVRWG